MRPLEVTMTSRCLFLVVLPPKKRDSFLWPSPSPFPWGLLGIGEDITIRSPSFNIRSLFLVKTGDHSISSCVGGGNSVIILDGLELLMLPGNG